MSYNFETFLKKINTTEKNAAVQGISTFSWRNSFLFAESQPMDSFSFLAVPLEKEAPKEKELIIQKQVLLTSKSRISSSEKTLTIPKAFKISKNNSWLKSR